MFQRPSIHQTFMNVALNMAEQATCAKLKTAAILVKNGRIISTGFNGVCSGAEHCNEYWYRQYKENSGKEEKRETSKQKQKKDKQEKRKSLVQTKNLTATQQLSQYLNRQKTKASEKPQDKKEKQEKQSWDAYTKSEEFLTAHKIWAEQNEIHAESNALLFAAKYGSSTDNCIMYSIYSPCNRCAKEIIVAGITKVYYLKKYSDEGIEFLIKNNVECMSLTED